jgi:hypothetical protein
LQHRQRRAQLVRRRGHEGAPRGLLALQGGLHPGEGAGEVSDLVAHAVLRRRRRGRALGGDAQCRRPQTLEAAQQGGRDRHGEDHRHEEAHERGSQQGVADLLHGGRDVRELALGDQDSRGPLARRVLEQADRDGHPFVFDFDDGVAGSQGSQPGEQRLLRRGADVRVVLELVEETVAHEHPGVRAPLQPQAGGLERLVALGLGQATGALKARAGPEARLPEGLDVGVAQALGQRPHEREGRHAERHDAREHERQEQAPAEPEGAPALHAGRNR